MSEFTDETKTRLERYADSIVPSKPGYQADRDEVRDDICAALAQIEAQRAEIERLGHLYLAKVEEKVRAEDELAALVHDNERAMERGKVYMSEAEAIRAQHDALAAKEAALRKRVDNGTVVWVSPVIESVQWTPDLKLVLTLPAWSQEVPNARKYRVLIDEESHD